MKQVKEKQQGALQLPLKALKKSEVETEIKNWLNSALELYPADELYVMLKQMEFAIETGLDNLKTAAYNAAGERFKGEANGEIISHGVKLVPASKWNYSAELEDFKSRQAKELKAEQLKEQASGAAEKIEGDPQIRVTLKG